MIYLLTRTFVIGDKLSCHQRLTTGRTIRTYRSVNVVKSRQMLGVTVLRSPLPRPSAVRGRHPGPRHPCCQCQIAAAAGCPVIRCATAAQLAPATGTTCAGIGGPLGAHLKACLGGQPSSPKPRRHGRESACRLLPPGFVAHYLVKSCLVESASRAPIIRTVVTNSHH